MSRVLDGSATLAWLYTGETTQALRRVFDMVADNGARVPALWRLEVANILEMGGREGRTDAAFRDAILGRSCTAAKLASIPKRTGRRGARPCAWLRATG